MNSEIRDALEKIVETANSVGLKVIDTDWAENLTNEFLEEGNYEFEHAGNLIIVVKGEDDA